LLTVVLCTSLAAWFGLKAMRIGQIRPPFWRRPKMAPAPAATPTTTADAAAAE
jgi:hypothetical protein